MTLATDESLAAGNVPPSPTDAVFGAGALWISTSAGSVAAHRRAAGRDPGQHPRLPERARGRLRRRRRLGGVRRQLRSSGRPGDRRGRPADPRRRAAARHRSRRGRRLGDARTDERLRRASLAALVVGRRHACAPRDGDRALGSRRASTTTHRRPTSYDPYLERVGRMLRQGKGPEEIASYLGDVRMKAFKRDESETADELFADRVVAWYSLEAPIELLGRAHAGGEQDRGEREAGRGSGDGGLRQRGGAAAAATAPTTSAFARGRRRSVASATTTTASAPSELPDDRDDPWQDVDVILRARDGLAARTTRGRPSRRRRRTRGPCRAGRAARPSALRQSWSEPTPSSGRRESAPAR